MKTALFFKLLFVCLACVAIRPVSAQVLGAGVFELKGQVVDSLTNEPVSFATLRVTRGEEITEPLLYWLAILMGISLSPCPRPDLIISI